MPNRRDFLRNVAGATAGAFLLNSRFTSAASASEQAAAGRRRQIVIGGRRIKVVDIHSHHFIPEVVEVVRGTPLEAAFKGQAGNKDRYLGPQWLQYMDKEGIDVMALNMNPWWYAADRDLSRRVRARSELPRLAHDDFFDVGGRNPGAHQHGLHGRGAEVDGRQRREPAQELPDRRASSGNDGNPFHDAHAIPLPGPVPQGILFPKPLLRRKIS